MSRVRDFHNRRTLTRVTAYRISAAAAGLALLGTVGTLPSASASPPGPVVKAVVRVAHLDHHLCYTIRAARGFKPPTGVVLKNQFNPRGFPVRVGPAVLHCNPVVKIIPGAKFPVKFPAAHLACFKITAPKQRTPLVNVTNQFGTADLNVGQPVLLCLPSWKRIGGPPRTTHPQPPGLGHFTCYRVAVQQGGYKPPPNIMLQDQFAPTPVKVTVGTPASGVAVPVLLCVPTVKLVHGRVRSPYFNKLHLLCFQVSKTPIKPVVYDKNQFGTAVVRIGRTALLCLPSVKKVLHL